MKESEIIKLSQKDLISHIEALINYCSANKLHLAIWRLPFTNNIKAIVQVDEKLQRREVRPSKETQGFMISPFLNKDLNSSYFIKADVLITFILNNEKSLLEPQILNFSEQAQGIVDALNHNNQIKSALFCKPNTQVETPKNDFLCNVDKAREEMRQESIKKIVISKIKTVKRNKNLDFSEVIEKICHQHPASFVNFFSSPETGTWVGSTPELLASIDENAQFRTVALAGTQKNEVSNPKEASWRQKEIEEQALVSRYIINCFKKIRLREFEEVGPKTARAADLLHLKSDFIVNLNEVNFPDLLDTMLQLLHPTSAVCGMPKTAAKKFILEHEAHDRSLYSGFLGPVNIEQETHLFVNLRCAQICEDVNLLYAGAGITEDSDPEKEWLETDIKCETIGKILS